MTYDIYIVKKSGGSALKIPNMSNISYDLNTPVSPMPLPEETHEENVLLKIEGNSAQINIDFKITQQTLDVLGTVSGNVGNRSFTPDSSMTSPISIINDIKDNFVPKSIIDAYSFEIEHDSNSNNSFSQDGTISSIRFNVSAESPTVWNCNIIFFVGNVVGLYEANVPYHPRQVYLTVPSAGTINVSWVASDVYANASDMPAVTGASVKYKKSDSPVWVEYGSNQYAVGNGGEPSPPAGSASTSLVMEGLSAGTYKVKVAQLSEDSYDSNVYYYKNGTGIGGVKEVTVT